MAVGLEMIKTLPPKIRMELEKEAKIQGTYDKLKRDYRYMTSLINDVLVWEDTRDEGFWIALYEKFERLEYDNARRF